MGSLPSKDHAGARGRSCMPHKYWSPELLPALESISIPSMTVRRISLWAAIARAMHRTLTILWHLEAKLQKLTFCLTKVKFRVSNHGRSQTARRYAENGTLHPAMNDDASSHGIVTV
jgi:hypothetical protein